MFHRNRRSVSQPPVSRNHTPAIASAAASAAALAFSKKAAADASLSQAAAAAALRSHASSPVPIGELQTKRMARRGSTSSFGSAAGSIRPNLQRRGSSSSMTERTFRSPSPSVRNRAPPMPNLPSNRVPAIPDKSRMRSSSLEPPMRVTSPTPSTSGRIPTTKKMVSYGGLANVPEQREREQVEDVKVRPSSNYARPMSPELTARPREGVKQRPASSQGFYNTNTTSRAAQSSPGSSQAPTTKKVKSIQPPPSGNRGSTPLRSMPEAVPAVTAASRAAQPASTTAGARMTKTPVSSGPAAARPSSMASRPMSIQPQTTQVKQAIARPASAQGRPMSSTQLPNQTRQPAARAASAMSNSRSQVIAMDGPSRPRASSNASIPLTRPMSPAFPISPQSPKASIGGEKGQRMKIVTDGHTDGQRPLNAAGGAGTMSVPSPTAEQMRVFHTRAASYLAPASPERRTTTRTVSQSSLTGVEQSPPLPKQLSNGVPPQKNSKPTGQAVATLVPAESKVRRTPSVSPARSTHFANTPLLEAVKHQPQSRAKSPAKSAMKPASLRTNSPSGSVRQNFNDSSDSRSFLSEDASAHTIKKKKSGARVSFDPTPGFVDQPPPIPTSAMQGQWNGDTEEGMGSRPALPSFGSVRKGKSGKVPNSKDNKFLPELLAQLPPQRSDPASVEQSGGAAAAKSVRQNQTMIREESTEAEDEDTLDAGLTNGENVPSISVVPSTPAPEEISEHLPASAVASATGLDEGHDHVGLGINHDLGSTVHLVSDEIEQLPVKETHVEALQTEESLEQEFQNGDIRGSTYLPAGYYASRFGAPATEDSYVENELPVNGVDKEGHFADERGNMLRETEPEVEHVEQSNRLDHIPLSEAESEDTTAEAGDHYADSTADQSEVGDGGYASLAAIMESPHAESTPKRLTDSTVATHAAGAAAPTGEEDWDRVRLYWSSLSEQRKIQLEHEAANDLELKNVESPPADRDVPKKVRQSMGTSRGPSDSEQAPFPPWPDQQYQKSVKQGQQPMKQTLRNTNDPLESEPGSTRRVPREQPKMRASMRATVDEEPQNFRPQSAIVQGSPPSKKGPRPASTTVMPPPRSTTVNPALPKSAMKAGRKTNPMPELSRALSNDSSASESSFKKRRQAKTGADGRYSMKRSMRAPPPAVAQDQRPTSPTGSRLGRMRMRSPSPSPSMASNRGTMRTSMRGPVDGGRGFRDSEKTTFGFGKSKPKQKSKPFSSRFNDSSDEEGGRGGAARGVVSAGPGFRSRFDDSDDEGNLPSPAVATRPAPMRSIPSRAGKVEGESMDLSDGDNARKGAFRDPRPVTPQNTNGHIGGGALTTGTLRQDHDGGSPRGKGLFGFSKRAMTPSGTAVNQTSSEPNTPQKQTPRRTQLFRRLSISKSTPTTPSRDYATDDYPFPVPPIPDAYRQGDTSLDTSADIQTRARELAIAMAAAGSGSKAGSMGTNGSIRPVVFSGRTGKKKKFQGLRRIFGLND